MRYITPFLLLAMIGLSSWTSHARSADVYRPSTFRELLESGLFAQANQKLVAEKLRVVEEVGQSPLRYSFHWGGELSGDIISTPIPILSEISQKLNFQPGQTLVDIGSGHGNPGLVLGALNPGLQITGYDVVPFKVNSAQRLGKKFGLSNVQFIEQNLGDPNFKLPDADYYYFFNPVKENVMREMAEQIIAVSRRRDVKVIVYADGWTPHILRDMGFELTATDINSARVLQYTGRLPKEQDITDLVERFFALENQRESRFEAYKNARQNAFFAGDRSLRARRSFTETETELYNPIVKSLLLFSGPMMIAYLRSLSESDLKKMEDLLDAFFSLDIELMDAEIARAISPDARVTSAQIRDKYGEEEIWHSPRAGQQTSWSATIDIINQMNPLPGELVVDIGSGVGRLGLMLGLLRPEVEFVGMELVEARVDAAHEAAVESGFKNVEFEQANLADPKVDLPVADYFYMFNPFTPKTADIVTDKLLALSHYQNFQVHLQYQIASRKFYNYFSPISNGWVGVYDSPKVKRAKNY